MKTLKKFLTIFLFLIVLVLSISCKKEKIEPHFVLKIGEIEVVDNYIDLEYGDVSKINVLFISEEYKEGTKDNIIINKNGSDEVFLLKDDFIICCGIGSGNLIISNNQIEDLIITINVKERLVPIERILVKGNNVLGVGASSQFEIDSFGVDFDISDIIFTSSDTSVATVEEDGYVTGVSEGKCIIKASLKSNPEIYNKIELNVIEYGEVTTTGDARFMINEATNYKMLPYGVLFQKITGLTSTPLEGEDADGYSGITAPLIPNQYYLQQISLLEVPSISEAMITSWANWSGNRWTLTTVKGLINNFEKNNPGWKVIAAVNGDFFDINANGNLPYQTNSVVVSNGNYYKVTGSGSVGFPNDGSGVIGNKPLVKSDKLQLDILDDEGNVIKNFEVEYLNREPGEGESSLYFAYYNSNKEIESFDLEAKDMTYFVSDAELALPNNSSDFYGRGIVSKASGTINITKGNFAIISKNSQINEYLKEGMRIRIQYVLLGEYTGVENITGCGGAILLNGEYNPEGAIDNRAPRTVIGKTSDGRVIMMVIDGRQGNKKMFGADARELAAIMKAYGCVEAFNLDGGGSSTLVIRQNGTFVVTNSPSDGRERSDSNCVLIVVKDIDFDVSVTDVTKNSAKINIKINDAFGKNINKLFIKMENEYYEVVNGVVELNNLVHNSTYNYVVCYENSKGELLETLTGGEVKTNKDIYTYLNTYVYEDSESFTIVIKYLDIDNSSTIGGSMISLTSILDGEENTRNVFLDGGGTVTLKKSIIGSEIKKMDISFSYQLDYKKRISVDMNDVDYTYIDRRN